MDEESFNKFSLGAFEYANNFKKQETLKNNLDLFN